MAERPIFHKEFGEFLAKLREKKTGWSQSDAARYGSKQSPLLTRQVILHLEAGKTKDPEPLVLRALAKLYGASYEEIAGRFIRQRYGIVIDLPDHGTMERSDFGRRSDVPATARVPAVDPVLVKTLENIGALVTQAITRARKGERLSDEDARAGTPQPGKRRRASGDR